MINSISAKIKTNLSDPQRKEQYQTRGIIAGAASLGALYKSKGALKEFWGRYKEVSHQYDVYQSEKENPEIFKFREKMQISVSDRGVRVARGMPTASSNVVMFVSNSKEYGELVINWLMKKSQSNFRKIDADKQDLLEVLEENERNKKPRRWDFLYAENMDTLINRSKSDSSVVESMKDIMCSCAEEYHTTILFITDKPEKLDKIALQPHRVNERFDLRGIKEVDFFQFIISDIEKAKYMRLKKQLKKDAFKILAKPIAIGAVVAGAIGAGVNYIYRSVQNANKQNSNKSIYKQQQQ